MSIVKLRLETRLVTMNDIAYMCYSKYSNRYANTKKKEQMFLKREILNQVKQKNYFKGYNVICSYEWHTSGKFDLGNLAVGEKFIADSINELSLWDDDRYIDRITHDLVHDTQDYVLLTIRKHGKHE